jgi:alpha-ketoglutarate-dependent taurine dioxygenase
MTGGATPADSASPAYTQLLSQCGVRPPSTDDPATALALVRQFGACLITAPASAPAATGRSAAAGVAQERWSAERLAASRGAQVFGSSKVLACPPPIMIDRTYFQAGDRDFLVHSDATDYGHHIPDFILFTAEAAADTGGETFLVDSYAMLAALSAEPSTAWLPSALRRVVIDAVQPDTGQGCTRPVVTQTAGRVAVCRPASSDAMPAAQTLRPLQEQDAAAQRMLEQFHAACDAAAAMAPRFKLQPGETVVLDNFRVFHGREPFLGDQRKLWRTWIWSDEGSGPPPGGVAGSFVDPGQNENVASGGVRPASGDVNRPKL